MYNPFEEIIQRLDRLEALMGQMHFQNHPAPLPDRECIGGVELAMQLTGLTRSAIEALCRQGQIPHAKQRGKLYFSSGELKDWLRQSKPASDPGQETPIKALPQTIL
jgi:predicted DNA-binding transcriptional regulator AlpA